MCYYMYPYLKQISWFIIAVLIVHKFSAYNFFNPIKKGFMKYNVALLGGAPLHLFLSMSQAAHLDAIFVMLKLNIWTPRWTFEPIIGF